MLNALWQSVLGEIELSVSHGNFETWFKHTELLSYDDELVVIGVANIFAKRQFEVKFDKQIREILVRNGITTKRITYQVKTVKKRVISRETTSETDLTSARVDELMSSPPTSQATKPSSSTLNPR